VAQTASEALKVREDNVVLFTNMGDQHDHFCDLKAKKSYVIF